jgi:hypothetical protein
VGARRCQAGTGDVQECGESGERVRNFVLATVRDSSNASVAIEAAGADVICKSTSDKLKVKLIPAGTERPSVDSVCQTALRRHAGAKD